MEYKTADDKELWEHCQSHDDEKAYAELLSRYSLKMLQFASRYIKDMMTAEELVMDTFFNLWIRRERINIEGKFSGYLSRCVHNHVVSYLEKELPALVGLEQVERTHQTEQSTDSHILSDEIRQAYAFAFKKLTPRRQEVFLLSRNENLSYSEIAKKTNLSVSTVDNHITAALKSLRINMKGCISVLILFFPCLF